MSQVVENNGTEIGEVKKDNKSIGVGSMAGKNYLFDINNQCIIYNNGNVHFKFNIIRQKSMETLKETLVICIEDENGEKFAEITTSAIKLLNSLISLNDYGIVLNNFVYKDIEQCIRNIYHLLDIKYIHTELVLDDDKLREIISMVIDYASEIGNLEYEVNGKVCYNIPVADFSSLIKDSEYKDFDLLEIKKELKNSEYTICSTGRYDRTIYNSDTKKAIKVISFDKEYILESVKGDK